MVLRSESDSGHHASGYVTVYPDVLVTRSLFYRNGRSLAIEFDGLLALERVSFNIVRSSFSENTVQSFGEIFA
jgi:hypothetical protein